MSYASAIAQGERPPGGPAHAPLGTVLVAGAAIAAGSSGVTFPSPNTPLVPKAPGSVAAVGWLTNVRPESVRYSSNVVPKAVASRPAGPVTKSRRPSGFAVASSPKPRKYVWAAVRVPVEAPNRSWAAPAERKLR